MLGKILLLVAIIGIIYFFILPKFQKSGKKSVSKGEDKNEKGTQNFVECYKCSTFIDVKDAVISTNGYICSECLNKKQNRE